LALKTAINTGFNQGYSPDEIYQGISESITTHGKKQGQSQETINVSLRSLKKMVTEISETTAPTNSYSPEDIYEAITIGFPEKIRRTMGQIAKAESGLRLNPKSLRENTNKTKDTGLFQINDVHIDYLHSKGILQNKDKLLAREELKDLYVNIRAAAALVERSIKAGRSPFADWEASRKGIHGWGAHVDQSISIGDIHVETNVTIQNGEGLNENDVAKKISESVTRDVQTCLAGTKGCREK
jgi:hypothetical protein